MEMWEEEDGGSRKGRDFSSYICICNLSGGIARFSVAHHEHHRSYGGCKDGEHISEKPASLTT